MGHLGFDNLKRLTKVADGIVISDLHAPDKPECQPCHKALAKRKPFRTAPRATKPGELIHVDLVFPLKPTVYNGARGYLSITDDCDGAITVYFIKTKPEAALRLQEYCNYKKTRSEPVLCIASDQESVIKDREFTIWRKKEGIEWRPAVAYHPEQNGMAEVN